MIKKEFSFTKYIVFILISLLMQVNYHVYSEELIPFRFEGKYGYLNSELEVVINPIFLDASHFSENGFAIVASDYFEGIIDYSGSVIFTIDIGNIDHIYDDLYYFELYSRSQLETKYNTRSGIINIRTNKIIIKDINFESNYYYGNDSENEFILVRKDKKYFYIDYEGNVVLENLNIINGNSFFEQRASITNEKGEPQIIDTEGNVVGNLSFSILEKKYSEGLIPAKAKDGTTGYVNRSGEFEFTIPIKIHPRNDKILQARNFSDGYALVNIKNNPDIWRIINNKGQFVSDDIEVNYTDVFYEGLAGVTIGHNLKICHNKSGFINTKGEYLVEPIFGLDVNNFKNGYAQILYNFTEEGLMNKSGKVIWSSDIMKGIIKEEEIK